MGGYLLRRAAWSGAAMFVFVSIAFFAVSALPFDYASEYGFGCPACALEVREELGLDRPVVAQYLDFVGGLARGSLGDSFGGQPVREVLTGPPLWNTLLVFGLGSVAAFALGASAGRFAAWSRAPVRAAVAGVSVLAYTVFPPFLVFLVLRYSDGPMRRWRELVGLPPDELHVWQATHWEELDVLRVTGLSLFAVVVLALLIRTFARRRRWPRWLQVATPIVLLVAAVGGWAAAGILEPALDVLFHAPRHTGGIGMDLGFRGAAGQGGGNVFLAIVAILVLAFGEIVLVVEATMRSELGEDYVVTARAKGLSSREIRDWHVSRNAILPAMSRFVVGLPLLLTGLIIVERELEIRGLSTLFFDAAREADLPVVLGALVAFGAITLLARLGLDVLHAVYDPRVRARGMT